MLFVRKDPDAHLNPPNNDLIEKYDFEIEWTEIQIDFVWRCPYCGHSNDAEWKEYDNYNRRVETRVYKCFDCEQTIDIEKNEIGLTKSGWQR